MLSARRPRQKDHAKFKASLGYTARLSLRKPKQQAQVTGIRGGKLEEEIKQEEHTAQVFVKSDEMGQVGFFHYVRSDVALQGQHILD